MSSAAGPAERVRAPRGPSDFDHIPQATLDRLRDALRRAEFNDDRLTDAGFGERIGDSDETWVVRTLAPDGALAALVRLWMVGASLDVRDAAAALAPATLDELADSGLLERDGADRVRAGVTLAPYGELLIAGDRRPGVIAEPPDVVPSVNPVARLLARHTVRTTAATALDLGTGNGVQALAAAAHCADVLATDVNPRALRYAALNARLNAASNVSLARGSWLEPVGERRFDLVVANPPFVVSPDATFTYRDSGQAPGQLSATLLREAARRLTPGGFAHVTAEWGVPRGADWRAIPRAWVAQTGCDALVLCHQLFDPIDHAVTWNDRLMATAPDRFDAAVERWTRYHREHGFDRLAAATVVLRRRVGDGPPWFSAYELAAGPSAEAGDHVLRIFAGEDLVRTAGHNAAGLLAKRLRPVEGLRVEQVLTARTGRWRQRPAILRLRPGLGLQARVAAGVLDAVFALDGRRTLAEVVGAVAARRGDGEQELRALALAELPQLVRRGLLEAPA